MDVGLQIALGLVASLAWGVGDFLSRIPTGRLGTPTLMVSLGGVGTLLLVSLLAVQGAPVPEAPWWAWALAAGIGLLNLLAGHLIFLCFYEGPISLTSPVSASYAAVTFVLSLLTGETASALGFTGLLLVLVGVPLAATPRFRESLARAPSRGVLLALGASLLYGFMFWALKYATPHLGGAWTTLIARSEAVVVLGALLLLNVLARPPHPRATGAHPWVVAGVVGVLDTIALGSVMTGTSGGEAAVVTALSSAYAVVTVGCAMLFLRERLALHQWAGVALVVAGVLFVSLG